MNHLHPLQLGSLFLPSNIFYSPLAGCSDYSYRKMANLYRPALFFCEMVKMEALVRFDQNTFHILDYEKGMHPIGAQLCGSNPRIAGKAAKIIEELGFDLLDLNCGCPVDKITKDGSGSGLLKSPDLIGEILCNMIAAVKIPITLKIRGGWDDDHINAPEITRLAENCQAAAIFIHGRTREQAYRGKANLETIRQCKQNAKTIKVIGNGDIFNGPSAQAMFEKTNCDGILVSRGTLGKPWIVHEIIHFLKTSQPYPLPFSFIKENLLQHITTIMQYRSHKKALLDIRKVGCWYLREIKGVKSLREAINQAKNVDEALAVIQEFSLEQPLFKEEMTT